MPNPEQVRKPADKRVFVKTRKNNKDLLTDADKVWVREAVGEARVNFLVKMVFRTV